jgi:hypothetical protein
MFVVPWRKNALLQRDGRTRRRNLFSGAWSFFAPGSFPFLVLILSLSTLASLIWTNKALRNNNLDWQSLDTTSHALMIYWEAKSLPSELLGHDQAYPKAAHHLAAALMPFLRDNPIQAMRGVALIALFAMLSAKYTLLCRLVRPVPGFLLLMLWQWLAGWTKFADLNHFTHGNYLFSQAVGGASFWLVLAVVSTVPQRRTQAWALTFLGLGLASGAYACHLVPGVMAFGTLGLFFGFRGFQNRSKTEFLRLLLTILVGSVTIFSSTQWQLMASARTVTNESWLPYNHLWLLLAWIPILAAALVRLARRLGGRQSRPPLTDLELILAAGLLVGGCLQAYFAYEWGVRGTTSAYTVKKFFFFAFPLASLLLICWLIHGLKAINLQIAIPPGPALAAALVLGAVRLYVVLVDDFKRPYFGRAHDPVHLAHRLAQKRQTLPRSYYYDPEYPMGSLYASVAGLRINRDLGLRCWEGLAFRDHAPVSFWQLVHDGHIAMVLLPLQTDPKQVFQMPVPAVEEDGFLRCEVHSVRSTGGAASRPAQESH